MKSLHLLFALSLATSVYSQSVPCTNVQQDGRVTFHLKAPNAKQVRVVCESLKSANMQKDDHGIWSFTTAPLEPDYYGYNFVIDGLYTIDMNNPLLRCSLLYTQSEVHVPGPASLPWENNDVPHGIVHRHFYKSAAAGDERAYYVYTPPGYKASGRKRYPVLYLLHGYSGDATAWWSVGRANIILDNLIARGQAKPMVIVMPLCYGTMEFVKPGISDARIAELSPLNMDRFRASLLDEVLPQVEDAYHVSNRREDRAIAGLSMGAEESLTIGLNNLDRFAWVGCFSWGGDNTNYPSAFPHLDATANDKLRLLWLSCGKDDGWVVPSRKIIEFLKSKGVHYTWTEVPGTHSWKVWRRNLADFAPLLFK